jgi:lysophospholipase L1-like esterase
MLWLIFFIDSFMAVTNYTITEVLACGSVLHGRFTTPALKYAFQGNNSALHLMVTGTDAIAYVGGGNSTPFQVSVDGGAYNVLTTSGGQVTLFAGLADIAHTVDLRAQTANGGGNAWLTTPTCLQVTGAAPAISQDANYGTVELLANSPGLVTPMISTTVNNYSSPGTFSNRQGEGFTRRLKAQRIYVWSSISGRYAIYRNGALINVVNTTDDFYGWRLLTASQDPNTFANYTICGPSANVMDAIMISGTGHAFDVSGIVSKRIAVWGDSITLNTACATAVGESYHQQACAPINGLISNRGVGGNTTAQVDTRIAGELSAIGYTPDLVILAPGRNDWSVTPAVIAAAKVSYRSCVDKIIAAGGSYPVLCVGTWRDNNSDSTPALRTNINTAIQEVVSEVNNPRVTYFNTDAGPVLTVGNANSCDGTHPNAAGAVSMGSFFSSRIAQLLATPTNSGRVLLMGVG